jgi:hypothetical protein
MVMDAIALIVEGMVTAISSPWEGGIETVLMTSRGEPVRGVN